MGVTSSNSSHALTTYDTSGLVGTASGVGNTSMSANSNVSPLPVRHQMNQMNTMPPLCQVCQLDKYLIDVRYFYFV